MRTGKLNSSGHASPSALSAPSVLAVVAIVAGILVIPLRVDALSHMQLKEALVQEVDQLLSPEDRNDIPGAAVLVVKDGQILLKKGYGLSNLENKKPITPDTAFLIGSITKQFTAMAIMMLVERAKLSYDDSICNYFPKFPPYAEAITIRHLLVHTSGLPDCEAILIARGLIDLNWPRSLKSKPSEFEPTVKDVLKVISQTEEPRFTPGTEWEYSNSGYVVLAQIVEIVSGQKFASFLEENIFEPLKMNRTVLCDKSRPTIKNSASSYLFSGGVYSEIDYAPQNAIYGHNNIYTTIEDMYKWDQALYTEELVSSSAIEEAFTSGKTNHGKDIHYGFGWRVGEAEGCKMLSHGGRWLGFRTGILRIPERHFTVVILANSTEAGISTWMDRIVDRCLD